MKDVKIMVRVIPNFTLLSNGYQDALSIINVRVIPNFTLLSNVIISGTLMK